MSRGLVVDAVNQFSIHPAVVAAANELDRVADALRAVVEASPVWAKGSIAAAQIAEESQFAGASSRYPVKHALLTGTVALGMATDHLTALAGIMRTERTVFAERSIVRPILSASGSAFYLLDSTLDTRERLRRSWSMHVAAFTEQLAMSRAPNDEIEKIAIRRRNEIWQLAEAAGFVVKHPEWKRLVKNPQRTPPKWAVGDPAYPTEGALLAAPLAQDGGDTSFGWSLFRVTSTFVHAQPTAITNMLLESTGPSEPGVANVTVGSSLGQTMLFAGAAVLSLRTTAIAALQTFGRDSGWWTEELGPILLRWREIMNSDVERGRGVVPFEVEPGDVARAIGFVVPTGRTWTFDRKA